MPKKGILISCSEEGLEPATKHGLNRSITTSVVKGFTVTRFVATEGDSTIDSPLIAGVYGCLQPSQSFAA